MRTTTIRLSNGTRAHVQHNSDWSGDATLIWTERGQTREATLPGDVLYRIGLAAAHESITRRLISALEDMGPEGG